MVSAGISSSAQTIADAIWPRTLVLGDLVWVKVSLGSTTEKFWAPARVTSLPFHQTLPIKDALNKICVQVLVWTENWQTWTERMEPFSNSIRMWDQISEAQALAALSPKNLRLARNLTEGIVFARKYMANVDREERRGRVELRAGMEVGFNTPGQRSKGEV
jgi:hypothetical protein